VTKVLVYGPASDYAPARYVTPANRRRITMANQRIKTTTSRTAEWTCLSRAMSSLEKNDCYRSDDTIALKLLPGYIRVLIGIPPIRKFFWKLIPAKGMYEYVIARTKYTDAVFKETLAEQFDQILIFGAGFDTRALRFRELSGKTRIFELDAVTTQEAKIGQYHKRGLTIPPNLTFIPIDFDKDSLSLKLEEAGFNKRKRSLFVLEGLLMYLQPESVDETFCIIRDFAGAGSQVVFDHVYSSVLRHEELYDDERKIMDQVSKAGENWHFGIEKGRIGQFLSTYDLRLCEQWDAQELEQRYFKDPTGKIVGHINGTHCLVRAEKA
jgi:methyltransferase (TIGR00027 family)